MPPKKIGSFNPATLYQIGIVVKDIDATVKFYTEVFGIGPFEIREVSFPDATYYGKKAGYKGKRAFAKVGPVTFELIELIEGQTVHEDYLRDKGEGIHHIGFAVEDLTRCEEEARKAGLKIVQGNRRPDGSGFAYVDSDRIGGAMFELIQPQKPKP